VIDNLYRINGPVVKAYLWLLCYQEERASRVRSREMRVSDHDLMDALGVSRTTAKAYRDRLVESRLITTEEQVKWNKRLVTITRVGY
jgi:hypothetical protein